jgi:MerR family transcriptional regulator, light-induced transcriptional regulator
MPKQRLKSARQKRAPGNERPPEFDSSITHRIGAVARTTGISLHTLRIWERRYNIVEPLRTQAGGRLYRDSDSEKLRIVKFLVDQGHAISQVAQLSRRQLSHLAKRAATAKAETNDPEPLRDVVRLRHDLIDALRSLDIMRADALLGEAYLGRGPRSLAWDLLAPLLVQIGDEWASVQYGVFQEHAATVVVRNYLGSLLRTLASVAQADAVISATLPGELHELGALMAALISTTRSYRTFYLGPSLPSAQIAAAATMCQAKVVLISAINPMDAKIDAELRALRKRLDSHVEILVGGRGIAAHPKTIKGIMFLPDLRALDAHLSKADS